jgi:fatty-acyl-CoA synthase
MPKGATLTHRNIVNNADQVTSGMDFTDEDQLCIPVPFYHCFGMVMGTLGCVSKGATMVVPGEGFEPGATLRAATGEKCTALYGVPTMFVALLDHPDFKSFDFSSLRTGIMAGRALPNRGDEEGQLADEHAGGDDRLRHDRDQPRLVPERR